MAIRNSSGNATGPSLGVLRRGEIRSIRELTDIEYEEYAKSREKLLQFSNDQQLFEIVHSNHIVFETAVSQWLTEYVDNAVMNWIRADQIVKEANRLILNFLSSVRTFLDHSEFKLKKRHGKDSQRVEQFEGLCSQNYDGEFSYRFVYQLRNYVQHCGMPVGHFSVGSRLVDGTSDKSVHHLELQFDRDQLLTEYDSWGTKLESEIRQLPAQFDINPHLRKMMSCIETINQAIISDDLPEIRKNAFLIKSLVDEASRSYPGTPAILFFKKSDTGPEVYATIEWIPLHLLIFAR